MTYSLPVAIKYQIKQPLRGVLANSFFSGSLSAKTLFSRTAPFAGREHLYS